MTNEQSSNGTTNQQERLMNLAWLAGFFEGEGSVSLVQGSGNRIMPRVHIINSDWELMEEWSKCWKELGVGNYVQLRKVYDPLKHKQTKQVLICGVKRVNNFCKLLRPFLRGHKLEVLKVVEEYTDYRLSLPNGAHGAKYGTLDYEYRDRVRALNKKGPLESSETTRQPSLVASEDIVQAVQPA